MERGAVLPLRRSPMLVTLLLMLLLLLMTAVSFSSCCDVRNDLRGAARKTQHAPVVFAGRVRSRGAERHGGFYQVTVDVESVFKGDALGGGRLRLRFRRPAVDADAAAGRRAACVADAVVETGERYIVFVKPVGGPRNFTAVAAPEKHSRKNMRKVTRILRRRRRGRSPPQVAKMKSPRRVAAGRRLKLQCRVRGFPLPRVAWFKNDSLLTNQPRRIRIREKKKRRRMQSVLIIRHVAAADAATYECRARNRLGKDVKRVRVNVRRGSRSRLPPSQRPRPRPTGAGQPQPPDSWRAAQPCDIEGYCLNGGSCRFYSSVREYVCQCAEGFKGKRCERKTVYAIKLLPRGHTLGLEASERILAGYWG